MGNQCWPWLIWDSMKKSVIRYVVKPSEKKKANQQSPKSIMGRYNPGGEKTQAIALFFFKMKRLGTKTFQGRKENEVV